MARLDENKKMKFVSETYIMLTKIDFSSARKRMSLVIEMPDGTVRLMVKVCVYTMRSCQLKRVRCRVLTAL